jgi:hypothetical protein
MIFLSGQLAVDPKTILDRIDKYFPLKEESIGEPDIYLGVKLRKKTGDDVTTDN